MNAKAEFYNHLTLEGKLLTDIKAASITREHFLSDKKDITILLPLNYTTTDMTTFISKLGFTYDSGYGAQELYGTIWFNDGSWSERSEYDGAEWWAYKQTPEIPKELR